MSSASSRKRARIKLVEGARLSYYREKADVAFWNRYWQSALSPRSYAKANRGFLAVSGRDFEKHLPRSGRIIEAGCGSGHVLMALRARGFDVEGVEWASETVEKVRALHPDLPIRVGDVTALDVPDGYYAAYISLGVIEHRREGPQPFLDEAYRILRPGGVAMISVPWFHSLRRRRARLDANSDAVGNGKLEFYQYAYTQEELTSLLEQAGFQVVDRCPHAVYRSLSEDLPLLDALHRVPILGRVLRRVLTRGLEIPFLRHRFGHMLMLVVRKPVA